METTFEESLKAAIPVKKINEAAVELDLLYLKQAFKEMKESQLG